MSAAAHIVPGVVPSLVRTADVVVIGPAPPLRGGIAAHTARLVEALQAEGRSAVAVSYRRLYPSLLFPGRWQRSAAAEPVWSHATLDVLDPGTWLRLRRELAASRATVVVQWWHPVVAPALLVATSLVPRRRLVAVCHNVLPHERVPGAGLAARLVLGRCSRIVCHSRSEQHAAAGMTAGRSRTGADGAPAGSDAGACSDSASTVLHVPLPCLLPVAVLASPVAAPELRQFAPGDRVLLAAGHLRRYKGLPTLLRAWKAARRPAGSRLLLAGESYLGRRELADRTRSIEGDASIVFVNRYVDDGELVSFLMRSEAVVAAHDAASQSGIVAIARALGLRCIVSDAGGLAEQIAEGRGLEDAGEVVARGDADALARAIERTFQSGQSPRDSGASRRAGEPATTHPLSHQAFLDGWHRVVEAIGAGERP